MLLNSLFLNDPTTPNCADTFDYYSPPKDSLDCETFESCFFQGSYPLAEDCLKERCEALSMIFDGTFADEAEVASTAGSLEIEGKSDVGSFNTCALTINSSKGHKVEFENTQLAKRPPDSAGGRKWTQGLFSGESTPSTKDLPIKGEVFSKVTSSEFSVSKLTALAIRLIDRSAPILVEEWEEMGQLEKDTFVSYMENIYSLNLTSKQGVGILDQLNQLVNKPPAAKRNEEKLKKTVKRVNHLMTNAFLSLNDLDHLPEEERVQAICSAYFGSEGDSASKCSIFSDNHAFTQKAFSKIVTNKRYAEDFEAILNSFYIPDFVKSREELVFKSIVNIMKRLENKQAKPDIKTSELIKRAPWSLTEIVEGVKLCQKFINSTKLF